jgi:hypothetical protein
LNWTFGYKTTVTCPFRCTFDGNFFTVFSDQGLWTKVADTKVVRNPSGNGAIIPASDFGILAPVTVGTNQRKSFYVTMQSPLIDIYAEAQQYTGNLQMEGDNSIVYIGAGFTTTNTPWPQAVDTLIAPQFAGVIHYKRTTEECDVRETTDITYEFLLRGKVDAAVLSHIAWSTDNKIDTILRNDLTLRELQIEHEIAKVGPASSFPVVYYGTLWV